jgi:uncharacterized membrane protein YkoI
MSRILLICMLSWSALLAAAPAEAARYGGERSRDRYAQADKEKRRVSLDQAVAMAERRYKARVVRAETETADGRLIYVLRLLNDAGRVWTVRVDAGSGEFL